MYQSNCRIMLDYRLMKKTFGQLSINALSAITNFVIALCAGASFWLYSRLTIDDAFISWRYGKNLVTSQVWNYNPTVFDLTQAYTNPIFTLLSIIPALLDLDTVMFFKGLSLIAMLLFSFWYLRLTNNSTVTLLLFLALPATIAHVFSGLETFLFVFLLSLLYISLERREVKSSMIVTCVLFLTRPEAWLLSILVPLFISFRKEKYSSNRFKVGLAPGKWQQLSDYQLRLFMLFVYLLAITILLLINEVYFKYPLPNTYYVKSSSVFSLYGFVKMSVFLLPLFFLLLIKRIRMFGLIFSFSFLVIILYSNSSLTMNYFERYLFHLVVPIWVYLTYLGRSADGSENRILRIAAKFGLSKARIAKTLVVLNLLAFGKISGFSNPDLITYYPRALNAHAALGKELALIKEKYELNAIAFGDAGMTAFNSSLTAFDTYGLGSSRLAHEGISVDLIESYNPDVFILHAEKNQVIYDGYNQTFILDWIKHNGFFKLCVIHWTNYDQYFVYTKEFMPELKEVCQKSIINSQNPVDLEKSILRQAPWRFWNE